MIADLVHVYLTYLGLLVLLFAVPVLLLWKVAK